MHPFKLWSATWAPGRVFVPARIEGMKLRTVEGTPAVRQTILSLRDQADIIHVPSVSGFVELANEPIT
jgi:hypothetical protein